jgi:hypothetical protein
MDLIFFPAVANLDHQWAALPGPSLITATPEPGTSHPRFGSPMLLEDQTLLAKER